MTTFQDAVKTGKPEDSEGWDTIKYMEQTYFINWTLFQDILKAGSYNPNEHINDSESAPIFTEILQLGINLGKIDVTALSRTHTVALQQAAEGAQLFFDTLEQSYANVIRELEVRQKELGEQEKRLAILQQTLEEKNEKLVEDTTALSCDKEALELRLKQLEERTERLAADKKQFEEQKAEEIQATVEPVIQQRERVERMFVGMLNSFFAGETTRSELAISTIQYILQRFQRKWRQIKQQFPLNAETDAEELKEAKSGILAEIDTVLENNKLFEEETQRRSLTRQKSVADVAANTVVGWFSPSRALRRTSEISTGSTVSEESEGESAASPRRPVTPRQLLERLRQRIEAWTPEIERQAIAEQEAAAEEAMKKAEKEEGGLADVEKVEEEKADEEIDRRTPTMQQ